MKRLARALAAVVAGTMLASAAGAATVIRTYDVVGTDFVKSGPDTPVATAEIIFTLSFDNATYASGPGDLVIDYDSLGPTTGFSYGHYLMPFPDSLIVSNAPDTPTISVFFSDATKKYPSPKYFFYTTPSGSEVFASTLTVKETDLGGEPAVPEPDTWVLMLLGFLGVGAAIRRRRVAPI